MGALRILRNFRRVFRFTALFLTSCLLYYIAIDYCWNKNDIYFTLGAHIQLMEKVMEDNQRVLNENEKVLDDNKLIKEHIEDLYKSYHALKKKYDKINLPVKNFLNERIPPGF